MFAKDETIPPIIISDLNQTERAKFSMTIGFTLLYNLTQRISFETGLLYSNKGYHSGLISLIYPTPSPNAPSEAKYYYHLHYLDIPLKARINVIKNKIRYYFSSGLITNLYLLQSTVGKYYFPNGRTSKQGTIGAGSFNRLSLSPTVGLGFNYAFNARSQFAIEPHFNYGILDISKGFIGGYLWNAGINFAYYRNI